MRGMSTLALTEEQLAVVRHDYGPALVFAVAGAGKTTAMVHRIERLVREAIFPGEQILATSFSRATVYDLRTALSVWPHCRGVQTATLHAVGNRIIQKARREGLCPSLRLPAEQGGSPDRLILQRTLARARQEKLEIPAHFDESDFLSYLSLCKGNFRYPGCLPQGLPAQAADLLSQAEAPADWPQYLELYQIFEAVRLEMKLLTFDDMLLTAWESLHRSPELLASVQSRYQAVLVDEFQDINHVQSELLDLLTARHRNYMAIGDDDQTIYEWRGANPRFILEFSARYQAPKYLLRDNFRSRASHLALANAVIRNNQQREPKALQLTQGFAGLTRVHRAPDAEALSRQLVAEVQAARSRGHSLTDMAVLLRIYAQTAFIEQALHEAGIAYQIDGSVPFFQRQEVQVLLAYLRLAQLELQLQAGHSFAPELQQQFLQDWKWVANRPLRYLTTLQCEQVQQLVLAGCSLTGALHEVAAETERSFQRKNLEKLADLITWLGIQIQLDPADSVLLSLEQRLDYCAWLRKSSGFPENGEARASTVEALLDFARGRGSVTAFLAYLTELASEIPVAQERLLLTTIYRAKGLEWPVVFVPHCNQGFLPYGRGEERLEEERRLFYVAITRPREELHLLVMDSSPVSRFLREAGYLEILAEVQQLRETLTRPPEQWQTAEVLMLARHAHRLNFERYLRYWWGTTEKRYLAAQRIASLLKAADERSLLGTLALEGSQLKFWQEAASLPLQPELFQDLENYLPRRRSLPQSYAGATETGFQIGQRVRNPQFGEGKIVHIEAHLRHGLMLEVDFEGVGRKRLISRYADLQRV